MEEGSGMALLTFPQRVQPRLNNNLQDIFLQCFVL